MKQAQNVLLIFDEYVDLSSLHRELAKISSLPHAIQLFPLTSRWHLIFEVKSLVRSTCKADSEIKLLESAQIIDQEVDLLRKKIPEWSANLGDTVVAGKSIKEWFLLPENEVSTWWFSLVSEKNSFKTEAFLRLAQLQAVDMLLSSQAFSLCLLSIHEKALFSSLKKTCENRLLDVSFVPSCRPNRNLEERIKALFNRNNTLTLLSKALIHFLLRLLRAARAKWVMGPIKRRISTNGHPVLFMSYFPAVDKRAAEKGILKNKYAPRLQEKLSELKKKVIWIWMYASVDGHTFRDALRLAKKFQKNGETNFLLDEFLSLGIFLRTLRRWINQIWIYFKIRKHLSPQVLCPPLSIFTGAVFIKNLMASSFIGWTGLSGILHFEMFKHVFSRLSHVSTCLYYLEMQAWEKALNAAKKSTAPQIRSIGYQHVAIFANLAYFFHPGEVMRNKDWQSLPLPDTLACNGDIPFRLLSRHGYSNLKKVEAIRYLYLADHMSQADPCQKRDILLVAGSTDKQETRALLSLIHAAFPELQGFRIWLKAHPALPLEDILADLKIDARGCGYEFKQEPISDLLGPVKVLVSGSTTVSMEALVRSCAVVIPVFSDKMFMSPLKGFEDFYTRVYNPWQLKAAVTQALNDEKKQKATDKVREFISAYWCLDPTIKRWEELLVS